MHPLIQLHQSDIRALCEKHGVKRLDLFGSAARGDFRSRQSDLDFFVEFVDYNAPTIADQWFGLHEDLETLLKIPVELVSARNTNPLFLDVANRHRVSLYAA
jgi:predicted nucleotidyltransferase